ncbi:MAG: NifB/NifX family molybdenum-iron cluster-binding protein, partial [Planctomycetes bacterium]|nr:NifB/NifX family molybdenum-iron cluster-binding protein [Planctomycetota bacterium]
ASCFVIYDTEEETFTLLENSVNLNAAQGAGIQAAQAIAKAGVNILLSGHCGPKAFKVLKASMIKFYSTEAATVKEAIDLFQKGMLSCHTEANVEGHWS